MDQEQQDVLDESIEEMDKRKEEDDDLAGGMDEESEEVEDDAIDEFNAQALVDSLWNLLKEVTEPYDNLWINEQC